MLGRVIAGRYRLEAQVGQGAMGTVWRAEHLTLGTAVAVKLLQAPGAQTPEAAGRFERDAKLAARIRSVHAVVMMDHGYDEGAPFIVMEWLDGESLRQRLDRRGRLTIEETARVVTHVARALTQAHELGLAHRDLKPANIFIAKGEDDTGEVCKVLDFGLAKATDQFGESDLATKTGAMPDTPLYASPEVLSAEGKVDFRSDLWSLAAIAFECLTGRPPFEGASLGAVVSLVLGATIPVPSQRCPEAGIAPELDAWAARALSRYPSWRHASAKELAETFRAAAHVADAAPGVAAALGTARTELAPMPPSTVRTEVVGPLPTPTALLAAGSPVSTLILSDDEPITPAPMPTDGSKTVALDDDWVAATRSAVASESSSASNEAASASAARAPAPGAPGSSPNEDAPASSDRAPVSQAAWSAVLAAARRSGSAASELTPPTPMAAPPPSDPALAAPPYGATVPMPESSQRRPARELPAPRSSRGLPEPRSARGQPAANAEPASSARPSTRRRRADEAPASAGVPSITIPVARRWPTLVALLAVIGVVVGVVVYLRKASTGDLTIQVTRAGMPFGGAQVYVDGQKRCDAAPCVVNGLTPGPKTIRVTDGPSFAELQTTIEAGQKNEITMALGASAPGTASAQPAALGALRVRSEQSGVRVLVNGVDRGTLPVELRDLPVGTAKLRFEDEPSYQPLERSVELKAGEIADLGTIALAPREGGAPAESPSTSAAAPTSGPRGTATAATAAPTAEPAMGTLNVNSVPPSRVLVDGRPVGTTPAVVQVPAGSHTVVFIHKDLGRQSVSVTVGPGETKTATVRFKKSEE